jgi:hypothetical protein
LNTVLGYSNQDAISDDDNGESLERLIERMHLSTGPSLKLKVWVALLSSAHGRKEEWRLLSIERNYGVLVGGEPDQNTVLVMVNSHLVYATHQPVSTV